MGFWNMRTGGAQLPEPSRGWTHGYDEFMGRYNSFLSNYQESRKYGANVQLLVHDLWGIDSYASLDETPAPGDNDDWSSYDEFLTTLFGLLQSDGAIDGLYWDIWNEPDNGLYLNRGLDRYLAVWGHTYHRINAEFPSPKTIGPSFGHLPNFGAADWWSGWTTFIAANASIPTQFSMHFLEASGSLAASIDAFQSYLSAAGIAPYGGPWNVNEYGNIDQQVPSTAAWSIAQLERHDAVGLRANWRGGLELHDYMANLLGKPHTYPDHIPDEAVYWPAREYPVYEYYFLNMTGERVRTEMTEDTQGDSYAVVGGDRVRILAGCRPVNGTWAIELRALSALGLPTEGELAIQTRKFVSGGLYDEIDASVDLGYYTHSYTDDTLVFIIGQETPETAYAFEFDV
ncbi:glycoside hydrolase superfamily [Neofusicoccum parvum]|nr:glycoside hydrolase superfamily [Neofusicoccum parvum]